MSFFDGILGPIVSGALGFLGQKDTNEAQMGLAREQMDFQERMSGTAYQRAVKDMQAAGLNPMLAYSQGGASSPGGAMATLGNPGAAASNAAAAAAQVQQTVAATQKTKAEVANVEADTKLKGGQLVQTLSSSGHLNQVTSQIAQEMQLFEDRWEKLKQELGIRRNEYWESERVRQIAQGGSEYPRIQKMLAEAQKLREEARLLGLKVPEALTEARFWSGPDAKPAVYFRHAPKNITSAFAGSIGAAADDLRGFKLRMPEARGVSGVNYGYR